MQPVPKLACLNHKPRTAAPLLLIPIQNSPSTIQTQSAISAPTVNQTEASMDSKQRSEEMKKKPNSSQPPHLFPSQPHHRELSTSNHHGSTHFRTTTNCHHALSSPMPSSPTSSSLQPTITQNPCLCTFPINYHQHQFHDHQAAKSSNLQSGPTNCKPVTMNQETQALLSRCITDTNQPKTP
ncbi:hypothetical protein M0R45_009113 [Rubus argutus]|uniref:Uncharacterized protein n=1 Tax=Rubus argutus TaxID=59490 RepID=A0AAW1Y3L7_RUBAR